MGPCNGAMEPLRSRDVGEGLGWPEVTHGRFIEFYYIDIFLLFFFNIKE